jgi:hypothetical protein
VLDLEQLKGWRIESLGTPPAQDRSRGPIVRAGQRRTASTIPALFGGERRCNAGGPANQGLKAPHVQRQVERSVTGNASSRVTSPAYTRARRLSPRSICAVPRQLRATKYHADRFKAVRQVERHSCLCRSPESSARPAGTCLLSTTRASSGGVIPVSHGVCPKGRGGPTTSAARWPCGPFYHTPQYALRDPVSMDAALLGVTWRATASPSATPGLPPRS